MSILGRVRRCLLTLNLFAGVGLVAGATREYYDFKAQIFWSNTSPSSAKDFEARVASTAGVASPPAEHSPCCPFGYSMHLMPARSSTRVGMQGEQRTSNPLTHPPPHDSDSPSWIRNPKSSRLSSRTWSRWAQGISLLRSGELHCDSPVVVDPDSD